MKQLHMKLRVFYTQLFRLLDYMGVGENKYAMMQQCHIHHICMKKWQSCPNSNMKPCHSWNKQIFKPPSYGCMCRWKAHEKMLQSLRPCQASEEIIASALVYSFNYKRMLSCSGDKSGAWIQRWKDGLVAEFLPFAWRQSEAYAIS